MAKEFYGVFESTNIRGRNFSFVSDIDLENGMLIHKGDLVSDKGTQVWEAVVPSTASIAAGREVYVVGNPALSPDRTTTYKMNEDQYYIPAGKVFRAYELQEKDRFGISDYSINGTPVVGEYIVLENGEAFPATAATAPVAGFLAMVYEIAPMGFNYWVGQQVDARSNRVRVEVVRN